VGQHLIFLLLGLANGAVFAALALSLVVTYRSSGVVNFATGAIALFTAYTYAFLRRGQLLVLVPGLPKTVRLADSLGFWPAALLATVISAVFGLVLYVLVFRPLRTAPAVARAVASIGVMIVLTGVMSQRLGISPVTVKPILPTTVWMIGDVRVSSDRVWFAITVVILAAALAAAFRFTGFGLRTRAAAENEKGAYVSGIAPDRLAAANWMISAAVGGVSGILIAPIVPLVPLSYTLFIVPALAAAILGRFQYLLPAVAGGLAIGMLQSEATYLRSQHTWLPASGLAELVPLALILVVLVVRARPLPTRGALIQQTLGRAPRPQRLLLPAVPAALVAATALVVLERTWRAALLTSLIFAIISLSLVVVTGFAGQVSLAQLTLAGVAGFVLGPLTTSWHVPFPVAPLLAALAAAVVGVVVGLPAIRIRGLPVAVVTLALGVALEAVWFRNTDFVPSNGKDIAGPTFLGLDLRARVGTEFPRLGFCFLVLVVLIIVAVGVARLRTSRLGSAMLAVRANERSAAGSGINVVRVKLIAFAIGSFIAGLGGSLLGYKQGNVTFDSFTILVGIAMFATVYLAGITSVSGGILAGLLAANGIVFIALQRWLSLGDWYSTITGVALVFTVIRNPEGIVGPIHARLERRSAGAGRVRERTDTASEPGLHLVARSPSIAAVKAVQPVLSLRDVRVRYGGVVAVDEVSFDVAEGKIVGLIGPNGAGKTTLLDAITGFVPATGSVALSGQRMDGLAPHRRVRAGLARTFQHIELYDDLSVIENVAVGSAGARRHRDPASRRRELHDTLGLVDLVDVADRAAGQLSQGRRQLVSIARAMASGPRVLLLDEPAGGLDTTESLWLGERLRRIRDSGVTILLVDHDMHLVLNLCDEVHVLVFGELIASGPPDVVKADREVAIAYLGDIHAPQPTGVA
jgi:ABC-type branched-subunit amino acid transport system ATPase component/ABC-type branched-subunit amino acid transport system permease subunit